MSTSDNALATTPQAVPTGNYTDKYGSSNPLVRRLVNNFIADVDELLTLVQPESLIDVGCGEGVLTRRWASEHMNGGRIVGIDLEDPKLQSEWAADPGPDHLEFKTGVADKLPFADNEFQIATAMEVLEHVPDPEKTLAEMARVSSKWILASVPREPIWRMVNIARGAYLKDLGNTPGHLNHWSKRSFLRLLRRYGTVERVRSPFPWTMVLLRLGV